MSWIGRRRDTDDHTSDGSQTLDERATVAGIRAGNANAFDELVVAHYQPLLRLAFNYLGMRETAEEVVQDVFLAIWKRRAQWSPDGALRLYLYSATRNRAFSLLRHRRVEQRVVDVAAAGVDVLPFEPSRENADDAQRTAELDAAIRVAIEGLPPRTREAFVLSRQQHLSHAEIARVMGTSIKTVQEQIGRALRLLRGELAEWL